VIVVFLSLPRWLFQQHLGRGREANDPQQRPYALRYRSGVELKTNSCRWW
jgi:hypothetical protein